MTGVEHHVEALVPDPFTAFVGCRDATPVQEHAEGFREADVPVFFGHLLALRGEPANVTHLGAVNRTPLEPAAAAEHRMLMSQTDETLRELKKMAVDILPVVPGDVVVLAVTVVVSTLRAGDFVAAEQHRHPLREEERRQEIADLPVPETIDFGVLTRPLFAAVPGPIVAFAVAVLFAVGFVVFVVVGDEITEREAIVRGDEIDAGVRPPRGALV